MFDVGSARTLVPGTRYSFCSHDSFVELSPGYRSNMIGRIPLMVTERVMFFSRESELVDITLLSLRLVAEIGVFCTLRSK